MGQKTTESMRNLIVVRKASTKQELSILEATFIGERKPLLTFFCPKYGKYLIKHLSHNSRKTCQCGFIDRIMNETPIFTDFWKLYSEYFQSRKIQLRRAKQIIIKHNVIIYGNNLTLQFTQVVAVYSDK